MDALRAGVRPSVAAAGETELAPGAGPPLLEPAGIAGYAQGVDAIAGTGLADRVRQVVANCCRCQRQAGTNVLGGSPVLGFPEYVGLPRVGEVPGAPGPGAVAGPGAPLTELPAKPAGEPADDLRQREEGGDEVAVYPEPSD
jgi:hypothetical protein